MKRGMIECRYGIGMEVGLSLVRASPALSLTGGPGSTHDCAERRWKGRPSTVGRVRDIACPRVAGARRGPVPDELASPLDKRLL